MVFQLMNDDILDFYSSKFCLFWNDHQEFSWDYIIWSHKCCCCLPLQLLGNDTTQQFDDLKVNLSNVNVFNNETRNSLTKLGDSGVDDIDFAKFLNEVKL